MPRPSKAVGSVALATGANRGIGLAFVRELEQGTGQQGVLCHTMINFV